MTISLKINLIASYAAQIYVALAGIVMLPFYLHFMGSEAYGLVAFFVMLQSWLLLLDLGLSPTMARETAQFRAGTVTASAVRQLLNMLETLFAIVATIIAVALIVGAPWLATHWLHIERLPVALVERSLMLMAPALALRLCAGLYRGAVSGLERIVWLSGFNATIATARYALVIPWFLIAGADPIGYFVFQLVVAVVEVVVLRLQCHHLLRSNGINAAVTDMPAPRPLRTILRFSASVGLGASLWSFITQVDKLLLSKLLSLTDYGYFSLAVVAASGVNLAAGPITFALSPRFTHLHAAGRTTDLLALYRRGTELVVIIAIATATMLICFAGPVLWAWTGRQDLVAQTAATLALYAAGNAINAVTTMAFYLQFANGDLRLHIRGLILMLLILVPSLFWGTTRYGMGGAGAAWLLVNLLYLGIWTAIIHQRFAPGLHLRWLLHDVARILIPTLIFGCVVRWGLPLPAARLPLIACLGAIGCAALLVATVSARQTRAQVMDRMRIWISRRRPTIS